MLLDPRQKRKRLSTGKRSLRDCPLENTDNDLFPLKLDMEMRRTVGDYAQTPPKNVIILPQSVCDGQWAIPLHASHGVTGPRTSFPR